MPLVTGLPARARTAVAGALGLAVAVALGGCSSSPQSSGQAAKAASPSDSPAASASATPSSSASASTTPVPRYVDPIPSDLRASLFTQGSVPASYADWISTSPQQKNVNGHLEVTVDRRLPPCTKNPVTHWTSDQHASGFAARLFQDGSYIVTRQLTVYPDAGQAKAAVAETVHHNAGCASIDGKQVSGSRVGDLVDAGELDIPQHDGTVAGETSVAGGGTGASWWTVVSRQNDAVVLTRVVDPKAQVGGDGSTNDSIAFRKAVLAQARTSASALDHYAG